MKKKIKTYEKCLRCYQNQWWGSGATLKGGAYLYFFLMNFVKEGGKRNIALTNQYRKEEDQSLRKIKQRRR